MIRFLGETNLRLDSNGMTSVWLLWGMKRNCCVNSPGLFPLNVYSGKTLGSRNSVTHTTHPAPPVIIIRYRTAIPSARNLL
jgi:hypothetical protein